MGIVLWTIFVKIFKYWVKFFKVQSLDQFCKVLCSIELFRVLIFLFWGCCWDIGNHLWFGPKLGRKRTIFGIKLIWIIFVIFFKIWVQICKFLRWDQFCKVFHDLDLYRVQIWEFAKNSVWFRVLLCYLFFGGLFSLLDSPWGNILKYSSSFWGHIWTDKGLHDIGMFQPIQYWINSIWILKFRKNSPRGHSRKTANVWGCFVFLMPLIPCKWLQFFGSHGISGMDFINRTGQQKKAKIWDRTGFLGCKKGQLWHGFLVHSWLHKLLEMGRCKGHFWWWILVINSKGIIIVKHTLFHRGFFWNFSRQFWRFSFQTCCRGYSSQFDNVWGCLGFMMLSFFSNWLQSLSLEMLFSLICVLGLLLDLFNLDCRVQCFSGLLVRDLAAVLGAPDWAVSGVS